MSLAPCFFLTVGPFFFFLFFLSFFLSLVACLGLVFRCEATVTASRGEGSEAEVVFSMRPVRRGDPLPFDEDWLDPLPINAAGSIAMAAGAGAASTVAALNASRHVKAERPETQRSSSSNTSTQPSSYSSIAAAHAHPLSAKSPLPAKTALPIAPEVQETSAADLLLGLMGSK